MNAMWKAYFSEFSVQKLGTLIRYYIYDIIFSGKMYVIKKQEISSIKLLKLTKKNII